jgi:hypothetical protein
MLPTLPGERKRIEGREGGTKGRQVRGKEEGGRGREGGSRGKQVRSKKSTR